jgi:FdhD protein
VTPAIVHVFIGKVDGRITRRQEDVLAIEAPLEIRAGGKSLSVTMRTPGHDSELAAGFLLAEGIIKSARQIRRITQVHTNIVTVELGPDPAVLSLTSQRQFLMTSACGLCGKQSLKSLDTIPCPPVRTDSFKVDSGVVHSLPFQLRDRQDVFESTGALHAAALFNSKGELESLREDVGRHNAVDKVIGHALLNHRTPLHDSLMLVSGRASFELVQKAAVAGIPMLAAVGAPSSLAAATAGQCGMTLVGFLRNGRFNVYNGPGRIAGLDEFQ